MHDYKQRLNRVIPGGAHTYSRGDDQFPANAPTILSHGEGAYVYDPDGNKYLDYGMGLRSVNIGYGNKEIAAAVTAEILKGNNLTRASITELQAAELLSDTVAAAEMVKFAKHGSTVTTAAIKLARAYTGRKYIAVPAEQPFFSFDDWFIGSTIIQKGVLPEAAQYTIKFNYNNIASLEQLFAAYPGQIAAVMLEPATTSSPCPASCTCLNDCSGCPNNAVNFLHQVKALAHANGSLFILDEMITGFRWHVKGAQHFYNIAPDLSTFGKAMANGLAVAALTGRRDIMELGSIANEGQERVFLTSTTHGAEMGALGAFIKTVEIINREDVIGHIWKYGARLKSGLNQIANELGISNHFYVEGYDCSLNYITKDQAGAVSLGLRTLFAQEMMRQGIIIPYVSLSFAHGEPELEQTLSAARKALKVYSQALEQGFEHLLQGPIIKPVFRKFN